MKASLFDTRHREPILARLDGLRPDAQRQWGRMSVGGMVCHLSDSFLVVLGERESGRQSKLHERTLLRWLALHTPMPWPRGVKTGAAVDQERGGTPPDDFDRDRATLRVVTDRFLTSVGTGRLVHPFFGTMSTNEWGHWGWRHMDHHLRQFSA
jgi:hypothetical protein